MNHRRSLPLEPGDERTGNEEDGGENGDLPYPTTYPTKKNLLAALVGYNPVVGDTIREDNDPGMKKQIFEVDNFGKGVCEKVLSFMW